MPAGVTLGYGGDAASKPDRRRRVGPGGRVVVKAGIRSPARGAGKILEEAARGSARLAIVRISFGS